MSAETVMHSGGIQSKVAICNKALRLLGAAQIVSLNQAGREADLCDQAYPEARNELLAAHSWSFACRRLSLAPLGPAGEGERFSLAYRLPVECLAVRRLDPDRPYTLRAGGVLLTDAAPARALLTLAEDDPSRWPPLFVEALARRLAAALAVPLLNSARMEEVMSRRFMEAFGAAATADAVEDGDAEKPTGYAKDPWIDAR